MRPCRLAPPTGEVKTFPAGAGCGRAAAIAADANRQRDFKSCIVTILMVAVSFVWVVLAVVVLMVLFILPDYIGKKVGPTRVCGVKRRRDVVTGLMDRGREKVF